jgi:hypothetical protein
MARYTGKSVLKNVYNISDYYPLDTRMLVPTYSDLFLADNWQVNGQSSVYNGMIVAVGSNKADLTKNGIYRLFDKNNPGADDEPDITNPESWHKLAELSDLSAIISSLSSLQTELEKLDERITALEGDSDAKTYGYRKDFPEVGEADKMYIAADEKKTYVWFNDSYLPVGGSDYEEPTIIFGGDSGI